VSEAEQLAEKALYRLSLDAQARALAERLLLRFRAVVGSLPASAEDHHSEPGGLYCHSLEVAVRALEEFEGNIMMERKPDGSVDSFRSAHNRPRWQYATFIAALCHDLGKLFDLEVRRGEQEWFPLHQPFGEFARQNLKGISLSWRPERQHGTHALLSALLLHHVISCQDYAYLGLPRLIHLVGCLSDTHGTAPESPLSRIVARSDQSSVVRAQSAIASRPDSKTAIFIKTLQELIANGEIGVNIVGGQVYAAKEKTAVVVPLSVTLARDRLRPKNIVLPPNTHLYNMLRNAKLVEADDTGRCVRKIKVAGRQGSVSLSALIFPTEKIISKEILPNLPSIQFEIDNEPETQPVAAEDE
jgi:hypothetical protein